MKPEKEIAHILSVLADEGWNITQQQEKQLVGYVFLVQEWNRKINLVSRSGKTDLVLEHLLPSMLYAAILRGELVAGDVSVVDLGSGGGFPGIVLSILLNHAKLTLVDASRKKTLFLKRVLRDLQLNADVWHSRVEALPSSMQKSFSFVVARGFANLSQLISYSRPLLRKNGSLFTLKGENYLQELTTPHPEEGAVQEIKIDEKWVNLAPGLAHKRMIKVEF